MFHYSLSHQNQENFGKSGDGYHDFITAMAHDDYSVNSLAPGRFKWKDT